MADQSTPRDDMLALVRRLLFAASGRNAQQVLECYAPDAVASSPMFGEVRGREAIVNTWSTLFSTFSDLTIQNMDFLVDGDRVAVLGLINTTDRNGWFGLPATGTPIAYRLVLLFTVKDGLIVHDERIYDSSNLLERLEKARLDKELRTAAEVQRELSSRSSRVGSFYESIGDSLPCRAIGGDFFEAIELPSRDCAFVMGDVSGKGPAAALLAAMVQGMFSVEAPAGDGPAATLERINRRLAARAIGSRFATLVYAVLSPDGRLVYANAGHNPPVLLRHSHLQRLTTGGPIVGAFRDARFEEETLQLHDRDTLLMFTDGVTEARNAGEEEFGDERLVECVTPPAEPADLLSRVFTAVRDFSAPAEATDDITLLVTRYHKQS
ncbi:MAG TPA: SpoIIE family protein phosphatase [Vicinamibacterales bacterium]|nr:SpoIIE family protein phosphatase [Vicinamibacterales bacterium]